MIVADRDDIDKNIRVLISQVFGIEPKTGVVPDVYTSLAQPDNITETPLINLMSMCLLCLLRNRKTKRSLKG